VIEPFRLIHTRRGWEIDAGPVTPDGTLGTFLVDRVHSYTVLDATFELPGNLEQLLVRQRTPVSVELDTRFNKPTTPASVCGVRSGLLTS
jgi:hypothetical protein